MEHSSGLNICTVSLLLIVALILYVVYKVLYDHFREIVTAMQWVVGLITVSLLILALAAGGFTGEEIIIVVGGVAGILGLGGLKALKKPEGETPK